MRRWGNEGNEGMEHKGERMHGHGQHAVIGGGLYKVGKWSQKKYNKKSKKKELLNN